MEDNKMVTEKQNNGQSCHAFHFSWSAVLIGTLIGVGLNFLCFLLELSVGLTAFPTTENGAMAFSASGFSGLIIVSVITMFLIGWITAYIGRPCQAPRYLGELYGFSAWSLSLVVTIFLAGYVGQDLTNYSYIVNKNEAHMVFDTSALKSVPNTIEHKIATPKTASEKNTDILGMTTFAIFSLFFISALSSCFGGRCAMLCRRKCMNRKCCTCTNT